MLDFSIDQAEGLRRLMRGPKKRLISVLASDEKQNSPSLAFEVASALHQQGANVLLVMESGRVPANSSYKPYEHGALFDYMQNDIDPVNIDFSHDNGFACTHLFPESIQPESLDLSQIAKMNDYFTKAIMRHDLVLIDARLGNKDCLPLALMNHGEIVIELDQKHESIKQAYIMIKRLCSSLGSRTFGVLIRHNNDQLAHEIFRRIQQVSLSFLSTPLQFLGYVPPQGLASKIMKSQKINICAEQLNTSSDIIKQLLANSRSNPYHHSNTVK
jgi:flagellar biosynthesis protein FlhG